MVMPGSGLGKSSDDDDKASSLFCVVKNVWDNNKNDDIKNEIFKTQVIYYERRRETIFDHPKKKTISMSLSPGVCLSGTTHTQKKRIC